MQSYFYETVSVIPSPENSVHIIIMQASGHFGEEDEELLHAFCTHAAVAIRNSRIYKQKLEERFIIYRK